MFKNNISMTIFKLIILCLTGIMLTVSAGSVCNLLNAQKIKNAFLKTVYDFKENWKEAIDDISIPNLNVSQPFTVSAKANISGRSNADITASYMPEIKRLSTQVLFENERGKSADLYAYCTPKKAGISLSGNGTTFYTIPASDFKNAIGSFAASALSAFNEKLSVDDVKTFLADISKKTDSISKEKLISSLIKLYSKIEWSENTIINLFSENPIFSFKISSEAMNVFLKEIGIEGIVGYDYFDNMVVDCVEKLVDNTKEGYYNFSIETNNDKIQKITCNTPEIFDKTYILDLVFDYNGEKIYLDIYNDSDKKKAADLCVCINKDTAEIRLEDCIDKKSVIFKLNFTDPTSKMTITFTGVGNQGLGIEGFESDGGYNLNIRLNEAESDSNMICVRFTQSYKELCDAQDYCSLYDAGFGALWVFNRQLSELKKTAGI
ncbi:MAG: hypothetical protein II998_12720 [Clostridia bacterium]|nr:hypothetical protein [Clostridia bacterium]